MYLTDHPVLPGWAPVLVRSGGGIQVGLDPGAGLLIEGAPSALADVLRLLDGAHTLGDLLTQADAVQIDSDQFLAVLQDLRGVGLLHDGTPQSTLPTPAHVRLLGAGALGQAVAYALLDAGVGELVLIDADPVDPARYPRSGVSTSQAQALAQELRRRPITVRVAEHWSEPEHDSPVVTVVATDRIEPDRAIGLDYVREDHPHLYLRPLLGGAVIGPLVRPGTTPCLGCLDLVRAGADPEWPRLLPQLCRARTGVDPLLARWAAATAVTQLIGELKDGPGLLAGTLELTAQEYQPRYRGWPVHPSCSCAW